MNLKGQERFGCYMLMSRIVMMIPMWHDEFKRPREIWLLYVDVSKCDVGFSAKTSGLRRQWSAVVMMILWFFDSLIIIGSFDFGNAGTFTHVSETGRVPLHSTRWYTLQFSRRERRAGHPRHLRLNSSRVGDVYLTPKLKYRRVWIYQTQGIRYNCLRSTFSFPLHKAAHVGCWDCTSRL